MKKMKNELKSHTELALCVVEMYKSARAENRVMHEFAKRLNVTPMQIIQHDKSAHISDIRHLYCKLRHDRHGVNYSATGREIGRAHATVKYAVKRINDLLNMNDKKTVEKWNKIRNISGYYL
jgi:chromosomal replication initiation ATPase DnaA